MNNVKLINLIRMFGPFLLPVLVGAVIVVPLVAAATAGNSASVPLAVLPSGLSQPLTATATLTGTQTLTPTLTSTVTATATLTGTAEAKVTICHRTGSGRNPYVEITVSRNALPAHAAHGDIIPAPAGGCPAALTTTPTVRVPTASPTVTATGTALTTSPTVTVTGTGTPGASPTAAARKITICHATGSTKNPYVLITIDANGLNGHSKHPGDIIPAPAGGCPVAQPASGASPGKGNGNGNNGKINNGNGNGGTGNGNGNGNSSAPGQSNKNKDNGNDNGGQGNQGNHGKKP